MLNNDKTKIDSTRNINNQNNTNSKNIFTILVICSGFIFSTTISSVAQKLSMYKFGERYSFFAAQFMNTLYVPLGMILIFILNFVSLKKNKTKVVTKVHTKFPQIIYAYCGLLDSFGIILTAISNRKTPGELQTLFSQLTVPFSMCWSMLLLKKRYNYKAFLGSLIILGGIALSAFTHISHSNTLEFFNQNSPTNILHCATYASGFFFFSLSFVIKEWCFNHNPDSIIYVVSPTNNRDRKSVV